MRREVVVGILMVCLVLEAIPVTTIAQPSPPIEFEGTIQDKDIITFKTEGGYEIGLHNNLAYSELDVFFDGVYQDTLPKGLGRTWFTVDHEITHVIVAAAEGSHDKGRAWHRYLSEEDWQEYYIQLKKSEIEDIDPAKAGIQVKGIIEIPFTYNVPNGLEWNAEIIYLDGKKIWCTLDTRDYSNPKVKLNSPATIKLATHLFENGIHNITVELVDSECGEEFCSFYVVEKSCRDTIFLDFQNTYVVPENWESQYTEGEWTHYETFFKADLSWDQLDEDFPDSVTNRVSEEIERLKNEGCYVKIKEGEDAAEIEFMGDIEVWTEDILSTVHDCLRVKHTWDLFVLGKLAALKTMIVAEVVFFAVDEVYDAVTAGTGKVEYKHMPEGDLEGNRYALLVNLDVKREYTNAYLSWNWTLPFFLNERGEWFCIGDVAEIRDVKWKGTGADCIEWIEKPTTIEKGKTGTFKLKIKDNIVPNLYSEYMHLDLKFPQGVKITNAKVNGEKTEILSVTYYGSTPGMEGLYSIYSCKSVERKGRITLNIPKESCSGCEEVSFDITLTEEKQEPIEILYGLIPGRVYEQSGARRGSINWYPINPITLPDFKPGAHDQRRFYYPYDLKHSFEIIPSIPNEEPKILSVPYYNQGNTEWCLPTSLAMVLKYWGENIHPWDIAKDWEIKPKFNIIEKLGYGISLDGKVREYVNKFEDDGISVDINTISGWSYLKQYEIYKFIKKCIDDNKPVIFTTKNHAVVIVGYYETNNEDSLDGKYFYVHDPSGKFTKDRMYGELPVKSLFAWHELIAKIYVVNSRNVENPPEAVMWGWRYISDGDIHDTYNVGSIDFMSFSEDSTISSSLSRHSKQPEKMKLNVQLFDLLTGEQKYSEFSSEFEVDSKIWNGITNGVVLSTSKIDSGEYNLWIFLVNSENLKQYDKIGPIKCIVTKTEAIDFISVISTAFSDFFKAIVSTLNEMVITLKEKTISVPPEQKAIENVERALGALSSMANAYSEFMKFIWEASGVEPSEYPEVKFNYHVLSSKFCENVDEAQTYMSSNGIESTDMNDAIELVKELELEKEGFCIVIVDYSFTGFGEKESGRYPVVCNEKGDPFWESWQFYEKIKGEIEEDYKEYK